MKRQDTGVPVIETEHLTKSYGKARGITDINLEIRQGEVFGFIGPNGAGKSTTIRTLLGLLFPTSGTGKILGLDIVKEARAIMSHVGFMPSEVNFYPGLNAGELLRYAARFYGIKETKRIGELASRFNLDLKRRFSDLSLGNRRKISMIQALLHKPKLLILDEPTTGLDPLMQKRFFTILEEEHERGVTIFLSSHTLNEVQKVCGRVAIIKEGKIIKIEDIKTLRSKQLKRVNMELPGGIPEVLISLEGVQIEEQNGSMVSFFFSGEINRLMQVLGNMQIRNITITEPELEEIFMHYYDENEEVKA